MIDGWLELGDRYVNHPDTGDTHVYLVVAVGKGSATVRTAPRPTAFVAHEGQEDQEDVGFNKPGRRIQVCNRPLGITLEEGTE